MAPSKPLNQCKATQTHGTAYIGISVKVCVSTKVVPSIAFTFSRKVDSGPSRSPPTC